MLCSSDISHQRLLHLEWQIRLLHPPVTSKEIALCCYHYSPWTVQCCHLHQPKVLVNSTPTSWAQTSRQVCMVPPALFIVFFVAIKISDDQEGLVE